MTAEQRHARRHQPCDQKLSSRARRCRCARRDGDGIDIAIHYGSGNYPGLTAGFLTDEDVFAVCSPKLLKGAYPLPKPEDLRHHALICDTYPIDRAAWLASAKVQGVNSRKGSDFRFLYLGSGSRGTR
ncbi:MAG: LysR substrate-binding domain-containing protein [Pseudomonadota bacterium]|nr:LysR substrate-binding domain-containing protein [Pseudomonadota bacterium]